MATYVGESKQELSARETTDIKKVVEKDSWIALRQYFSGAGNGPEAKVACVVIGTLAREQQARNNERQLDILERRLALGSGEPIDTRQINAESAQEAAA